MAPTISSKTATKKNLAQPTVASQSPMRAPIPLIVGADARPAPAAALRVHANALRKRDLRGGVVGGGNVSADAAGLSVLFSVVMHTLYKASRMNTNLVRQIAFIDQWAAQIAIERSGNAANKRPGLAGPLSNEEREL